ncbi:MAG TPA: MmgE/PrpD family protein, partial [Vitreimonas sp.]|nr:MmgE/PrpD family protein [Vitreimonas sp.]
TALRSSIGLGERASVTLFLMSRQRAAQISPVMRRLSAYIASAPRRPLPAAVAEKTKHHILDTIAAMVSGSRLAPGKKAVGYVKTLGGGKEACVIGSKIVTSAVNAALANGMLAHADETDDSHAPSLTHPGCGIVPAALALAEREQRNGTALLRAVTLGYDVGCRLTQSLDAYQFREDGHSTHSFGPMFGAAAAAGALAGLRESQVRHVLSFTAQQASGISCWMRDGEHIEKAFDFGGMPARNGVAAATMVAHGFTGVDDVFAGERNFFVAYGRAPDPASLIRGLGDNYEIMNTNIKRWSVGSPIQAPLDSLVDLIREHGIRADDVEGVVVRVAHQGANTVDNRAMPDICMQHMCAVMLIDGKVTFASSHDEKRMRDSKVLALRSRIELRGDDGLSAAMPSRQGIVEIILRDGRELKRHTQAVRGSAENPMTRGEVDEKSYDLIAPVLGRARARKLCDAIWQLEKVRDARALRALLRA